MTVSFSSSVVAYAAVLLINSILCVNGAPDGIKFHDGTERGSEQKIIDELNALEQERELYNRILQNFLKPVQDIMNLEEKIGNLSTSTKDNHKDISELKDKLTADRRNMDVSLQRQEQQLAKLEPQVDELQKNWVGQTSELGQLKQLWKELGEKAVTGAAEVQTLRVAGQDLDRHLGEQQKTMQQQETAAEALKTSLKELEESMVDTKKDLEVAFNSQESLEAQLLELRSELAKLAATKVSIPSPVPNREADSLCRSLGLA